MSDPGIQLSLFSSAQLCPAQQSPAQQSLSQASPAQPETAVSWPLEATDSPRPQDRALFDRLQRRLGGRLSSLVLTDNRQSILSVRPSGRDRALVEVRLHRAFADAPEDALDAVAILAEGAGAKHGKERRSRARQIVRGWMDRFWRHHGPPASRGGSRHRDLNPVGATLDLRSVRDDLNRRFFDGRLSVEITWSRVLPGAVCRTRSIRLGSFQEGASSQEPGIVRIHPALDQPRVPRYVVESVVHHELLHADIPAVVRNGRRHVHTPELRRRERQFPDHQRAKRWIRKNLQRLLRF